MGRRLCSFAAYLMTIRNLKIFRTWMVEILSGETDVIRFVQDKVISRLRPEISLAVVGLFRVPLKRSRY